ncbi:MAG: VCBS repeat-containing protein [Ignavibacteriae bacterium]|nr:VCBS repeat-containing protein [Ignavibacteriota bacterium]MCB9211032.1 VCBS repeat-containing protein [Ignavibacteriales bacterium]
MRERNKKSVYRTATIVVILAIILFGIPIGFLEFQSIKTGKSWDQIASKFFSASDEGTEFKDVADGEKIEFLVPQNIGSVSDKPPQISHIQTVDLDQDNLLDVIVCDVLDNKITWIQQSPKGVFTEKICSENIMAPSHIQAVDFDKDGDVDLIVSLLGMLFPNNDKIGSIVILENDGKQNFTRHLVVEKVARVSDVRAGDLDGDGDLDLAAVQFGYDDGETRWLKNEGNWKFTSYILQTLSGGINCELVDIDNDSDLDIITLISQEWEETYLFINDGVGNFNAKLIYGISNDDFGSSGIYLSDFDQDGDMDVLYTNGDAFDYMPPRPRPWHGVNWLENVGDYNFTFHRISNFGGAYNARPLDVDHDGDLDIFVVSAFNLWDDPSAQSFIWLENDGKMNFIRHDIANTPTHILALELGDFNQDGQVDMVTGGMHVYPPFNRIARIMLWTNNWNSSVN